MGDINRWHGTGRLTRDLDVRMTNSGTKIVSFGMCCNDRVQNQQTGQWEDRPNFIDVTVFGNRADFLCKHLAKGKKVSVEGRLRWSQWEKDGQKRSKLEVIADEVDFELPPRPEGYQQQAQAYGQAPQQYAPQGYQQQQYQQPYPPQGYAAPPQQPHTPPQAPQARQMGYQPMQPAQAPQTPPQAPQQPAQAPVMDYYDEDIPF